MSFIQDFWHDESGLVLSAEAVTIGTVGVLGSIVGLSAVGTAVDGEMKELASAIRSLDQSYGYVGHSSCFAWSAGSYYRQPDVQLSLAELSADGDINTIQQRIDAERKGSLPPAGQPQPIVEPAPPALPNQIPSTKSKSDEATSNSGKDAVPSRGNNP